MTYSIIARDEATGHLGIAVASRFFAVGALVPHLAGDVGVATQAFVNPMWGVEGAAMLAQGLPATEVLATLIARDAGETQRQCHMIDRNGAVAAHTGAACVDWAGHIADHDVSVAGNMLTGPEVIEATRDAWLSTSDQAMPDRLLTAMRAGEVAGGDKRGRQSAALVITRGEPYPWLDLRVDDHGDPLTELGRLLAVARERFVYFAENMGTRARFEGTTDRALLDAQLASLEQEWAETGYVSASAAVP
ncbi:MAG: DUF1028 domain-containing protein [Pseudomonadota bacterium]